MKIIFLLAAGVILVVATAGASLACDQDIQCPVAWVWSDKEGTCVEAPLPSLDPLPTG